MMIRLLPGFCSTSIALFGSHALCSPSTMTRTASLVSKINVHSRSCSLMPLSPTFRIHGIRIDQALIGQEFGHDVFQSCRASEQVLTTIAIDPLQEPRLPSDSDHFVEAR